MSYLAIKHAHAGVAMLSGFFFVIRYALFYFQPLWRQQKLLKILPHVLDSLLLALAIALCVMSVQYPLQQGWLTAKVFGLISYIVFGTIAIRQGKGWAFVLALLSFGYILGAAIKHSALSWGVGLI